jgi:hypothetical protein
VATLHVRNFPEPLYEALRACAEAEGRSIGAQAIVLLEAAFVPGRRQRAWRGGRRRSMSGGLGFGRFTEKGRTVVVRAQDAARAFAHNYVGTEHVLLGLLQVEDSVAARALDQLRVDEQTVRTRIEEIVGRGSGTPPGAIPFTPRTKKVLELALRESLELRHDYIGTEHLLLAIVKEGEGVAAQILRERDVEEPHVRGVVLGLLGREPRSHVELEMAEASAEPPYRAIDLQGSAERWTEQMNELADDGWELVSLQQLGTGTRAVFRRPD